MKTTAARLLGSLAVAMLMPSAAATDFAESAHVDDWLRHPVYGDPSFYLRGDYPKGYLQDGPVEQRVQARCLLHRSKDRGKIWEALGPVVTGDPPSSSAAGRTPSCCAPRPVSVCRWTRWR